ncbi:hypothetical protein [uncultured Rikenella sp.]|uniref:hypothetical protein n=1 Tax=uncultured Rikenella sp. TaxID=368003 RepID=UPI002632A6A4|nr:hypothetical protein [uncultured Rikenella sp.]
MEVIKREVNGLECEVVISDSVIEGLHQLQDNDLADSYSLLFAKVIRFLTDEYDRGDAQEILSCISSLSIYGEIIRKLTETRE